MMKSLLVAAVALAAVVAASDKCIRIELSGRNARISDDKTTLSFETAYFGVNARHESKRMPFEISNAAVGAGLLLHPHVVGESLKAHVVFKSKTALAIPSIDVPFSASTVELTPTELGADDVLLTFQLNADDVADVLAGASIEKVNVVIDHCPGTAELVKMSLAEAALDAIRALSGEKDCTSHVGTECSADEDCACNSACVGFCLVWNENMECQDRRQHCALPAATPAADRKRQGGPCNCNDENCYCCGSDGTQTCYQESVSSSAPTVAACAAVAVVALAAAM